MNKSSLEKKEIQKKKVKILHSNNNANVNNNVGSSDLYQKELASKLALRKAKDEAEQIKLERETLNQHNKKEIELENSKRNNQEDVIFNQLPVLDNVLEDQVLIEGFVNINGQLYDYDPAVNPFANVAVNVMLPDANPLAVVENFVELVEVDGELFNYDPSFNPFASVVNLNEVKLDQVAIKVINSKRALPIPKPIVSLIESKKKIIPMTLPSKGLIGTEDLVEQFSKDPLSVKDSIKVKKSISILDVSVEKPTKESFAKIESAIEIPLLEADHSESVKNTLNPLHKNCDSPKLLFSKDDLKLKAKNLNKFSIASFEKMEIKIESENEISLKKGDHSEIVEKTFVTMIENKGLPKILFSKDDLKFKAKNLTNSRSSLKSSIVSFKENENGDFLKASLGARRQALAPIEDEIISDKSPVINEDSAVKNEQPVVELEVKKPIKIQPPIIRPAFNFSGNDFLVKKNSLSNVKELKLVIVEEPIVVVNQWDSVVSSFQDKAKDANLIPSDECGDWEDD